MEPLEGRSRSLISQVEKHAREKVELHINICPHLADAFMQNSPAADRAVLYNISSDCMFQARSRKMGLRIRRTD
jgi:hypothetical protein